MVFFTLFICKLMLNLLSFPLKYLERIEKVRTFALAFENDASLERQKKSSLKDLHNREVVVQEAIEKSIG